jgi:hypothetical protein
VPGHGPTAVAEIPVGHPIAVGQQDRIALPVGHDGGGEHRLHVGPVEVVGDAAEPFRLALGAVHAAGTVQTFERRVRIGLDHGVDADHRLVRQVEQGEGDVVAPVLVAAERHTVDGDGNEFQADAVQHQRQVGGGPAGTADRQPAAHPGRVLADIKM